MKKLQKAAMALAVTMVLAPVVLASKTPTNVVLNKLQIAGGIEVKGKPAPTPRPKPPVGPTKSGDE